MRLVRRRLAATVLAGVLACFVPADPVAAARQVVGGPELATTGTVASPRTPPLPRTVTAPSFVVADLDSGAIYAARNPHLKTPPASTLKTLTALVLLPRLNPHQVVVASNADVSVDGTRVGIVPGGRYTVDQLFQALLMMSGNDAAELLARTNRTRAVTLQLMNAEAQRLRAEDTHAGTPSGLDAPGQTTSAYDLALIARAAMRLPAFRHYVAMRRSTFGAAGGRHFVIDNKNRLLRFGYPGAIGVKDGFTDAAQHTFIGAATRGGRTYLVTIMHSDRTYWKQAEALLDWAFAMPKGVTPIGRLVDPAPVSRSAVRAAAVLPSPDAPPLFGVRSGRGPVPGAFGVGLAAAVLIAVTMIFYGVRRFRRGRSAAAAGK